MHTQQIIIKASKFITIAITGLALKLILIKFMMDTLFITFHLSFLVVTALIITLNFYLNNRFTFSKSRKKGTRRKYAEFIFSSLLCNIIGTGICFTLRDIGANWWSATIFAGALSSLLNFLISSLKIWNTSPTGQA